MTHLIYFGVIFLVSFLSFLMGGLLVSEIDERKYKDKLQRATRPAHIKVEPKVKVQHFIVQPGALDIDFPKTEDRV